GIRYRYSSLADKYSSPVFAVDKKLFHPYRRRDRGFPLCAEISCAERIFHPSQSGNRKFHYRFLRSKRRKCRTRHLRCTRKRNDETKYIRSERDRNSGS